MTSHWPLSQNSSIKVRISSRGVAIDPGVKIVDAQRGGQIGLSDAPDAIAVKIVIAPAEVT